MKKILKHKKHIIKIWYARVKLLVPPFIQSHWKGGTVPYAEDSLSMKIRLDMLLNYSLVLHEFLPLFANDNKKVNFDI